MSELLKEFSVHKRTATHADALKAVGLADLLQSAFDNPVEIRDEGAHFLVSLPEPLGDRIQRIPHSPGYPWLKSDHADEAPKGLSAIDVSAEFARVKRWAENRKKLFKMKKNADPELLQLIQEDAPIPRWWILAALTPSKLKAIDTWNRVATAIANVKRVDFLHQVEASLKALSVSEPSSPDWTASSSGLFCPSQIKGFNELKPQGTSRGSVPVNAFEEWLRYRGYWQSANLVSSSDTIRLYVPVPGRVTSRSLRRIGSLLEKEPLNACGPQSDILATIALARLLIEHSREYHSPEIEPDAELSLPMGATPSQILTGLHVTQYTKTSQQAYGVQTMSFLALPDWFPIRTRRDAQNWLAILDEHRRVVRGLRDDRSDEIGLLMAYRRFLQKRGSPALWTIIEFMETYGALVMRANGLKRENRTRWMTRFTDEYFRRMVSEMNTTLSDIVNNPGFDAIARAVRQATVTAQNKRARYKAGLAKEDEWREIRYELLHDIHRTRKVPGTAFIECVSEFISRYNYENARHREEQRNPKAAPSNVSDEEMKSFLALVGMHGTSVLGALLAAYGTCKEKWEGDDEGARSSERELMPETKEE